MNSKLTLILAGCGAAFIFAADQPKKDPNEFEKLKAKVTLLEGRVAQLESRLLSLSQTPRTVFGTPKFELNRENNIPPNVGELEVNGLKVYKVPLTQPAN
jgi:hypothetical protein